MISFDSQNKFNHILNNKKLHISNECLNDICKKNQDEKTCKYIMLGNNGFVCVKNTEAKAFIDNLKNLGKIKANGDNCQGKLK